MSLEWAQQVFDYHKAHLDTLDKETTREEYMELIEQNVEGSLDFLTLYAA